MSRRARSIDVGLPLLAALCLCAPLRNAAGQDVAQLSTPPSLEKIESLLTSGEPRQQAWGAHYAIDAASPSLTPALLDLTERWQSPNVAAGTSPAPDQIDEESAMAAVLDAIIQLRIPLPAATLRNLAQDFPNQTAIVLSRLPGEESQTLDLEFYRSHPNTRGAHSLQYVATALLAQSPPAGFVADLFGGIQNRATVTVVRPGVKPEERFTGGSAGCCFDEGSHADWPEFGNYQLSADKMDGSQTLVPGPDPVYMLRSKTRMMSGDSCDNFTFIVLGPEERRRFPAHMLGIAADDVAWENEVRRTIEFRSEPQFYRELLGFISAEQAKYRATGAALVAKNLMTVSEQEQSIPSLDLEFHDQRGQGSAPLTAPANLPANVVWPKP